MSTEKRLIDRYFSGVGPRRDDVLLGIGDDAALLRCADGSDLALSTDTLVLGTHFTADSAPRSVGHRALAVNLSDLAAMGAAPAWALLSLTLPAVDEAWLAEFAAGFRQLAEAHAVALVGGNLCRGPLQVTVQIAGKVAATAALRRDGAKPGDLLLVSGTVGNVAAALDLRRGRLDAEARASAWLHNCADYPQPRVALGQALRGVVGACIDLSDGLAADLPRLLHASGCGASVEFDALPLSPALQAAAGAAAWRYAWTGGEDYELCCSVPAAGAGAALRAAAAVGVTLQRIGHCLPGDALELRHHGAVTQFSAAGFSHFD